MTKLAERLNLPVSADLLERLDAYRAGRRPLPSRAEAARLLIEAGLEKAESAPTIPLVRAADFTLEVIAEKLAQKRAESED